MCMVTLSLGVGPRPVHHGWQAIALPDIGDAGLRDAIWASARFADRIVAQLLNHGMWSDTPATGTLQTTLIIDDLDDAFLHRLGQLWLAPALAVSLLDPVQRTALGLTARDDLRRVLSYRQHCDLSVVGPLPDAPDYPREGARCVAAWLAFCADRPMALRLRLTLAADLPKAGPCHADRVALVTKALADPAVKVQP